MYLMYVRRNLLKYLGMDATQNAGAARERPSSRLPSREKEVGASNMCVMVYLGVDWVDGMRPNAETMRDGN
jgi:hypothetical protein